MKPLDWIVLAGWLAFIVSYGLWRGRGSNSVNKYMLAGKSMPWYAMGLSIMATQASAITFISTTGQSYVDGMRFVQFYFGLPVAMVILCATAVPIFHRAKVYTAYEYLEKRFDAKTRGIVTLVFLIQRGLSAGISLYAPAAVLSVVLHWPDRTTTVIMGGLMIAYTSFGGIKAITWADVQQMTLILSALVIALVVAIHLMPANVHFSDALALAGAAGKLNAVDLHFDPNDRYNLWSGLIGGGFLALAYFGCDQSQVQRYLAGKSIGQSRLSLLFNAMAKIPMQFFILFIGAMVFVLFLFDRPPLTFQPVEMTRIQNAANYSPVQDRFNRAFEHRKETVERLLEAHHRHDGAAWDGALTDYRAAQREFLDARAQGVRLVENTSGLSRYNDTNYIFLSFVTRRLPIGLVGLIVAVIFSAAMSSTSGEINSLATVTIIDLYKRHVNKKASDHHYVTASRLATGFWGCFAIAFASFGSGFGALIETVNMVGSLFYGGMLGVFVLAFFFPRVTGTGAFFGVLAGEGAIFACSIFTNIAFLWYNVIGCLVVIGVGVAISVTTTAKRGPLVAAPGV